MPADALTAETVELLQQLIRNACVNDGTASSGQEVRSADVLTTYLEGAGLDVQTYEPTPGRRSIVARIEGSDPEAPSLCLMGHTDVVPVSPAGWSRDPFGGELVDGEVWGRGAVDMLNLTASMAVATKHLARQGWRPKGTLIYLGVADEEAGGEHGAEWLVNHHWDDIACDDVVTESGGWGTDGDTGRQIVLTVGEKGVALAPPGRARHARPRVDALRRRQRPRDRSRGGPPPRHLPARRRDQRHLPGLRRVVGPSRRAPGRRSSTRGPWTPPWPTCPTSASRSSPTPART